MRILIKGAGWYGCHLGLSLKDAGHEVTIEEFRSDIFLGASGSNPARLHVGFHYPRSALTQESCIANEDAFIRAYGFLIEPIKNNIYAVAEHVSVLDFGAYKKCVSGTGTFEQVSPSLYGLRNVQGALKVVENHIVIARARQFFRGALEKELVFNSKFHTDQQGYDWTIDCTFSQSLLSPKGIIDRYEPCMTLLIEMPTDTAITIMDGPLPSLYPWSEEFGLCSLTSALFTPLTKNCKTYAEAQAVLEGIDKSQLIARARMMVRQMEYYYPAIDPYAAKIDEHNILAAVRAMPANSDDARLCKILRTGEKHLSIVAGKIDAIFHAEKELKRMIGR